MEPSILKGTKKMLGVSDIYTAFDTDIIIQINSVFSVLQQLGIGPVAGFFIEDSSEEWEDYIGEDQGLNMIRTYLYLKVRMLFDPPTTSYMIKAMEKQIEEHEWRISTHREWQINPVDPTLPI